MPAMRFYAYYEANIPRDGSFKIIEGTFPVDEKKGEVPICQLEVNHDGSLFETIDIGIL